MPSSPEGRAADWAEILDEFEQQLARVDLLAAELEDAGIPVPPSGIAELATAPGAIPEEMRARARSVLDAQREAMGRLERLRTDVARHIGLTRAASTRPDVAVYLDLTA